MPKSSRDARGECAEAQLDLEFKTSAGGFAALQAGDFGSYEANVVDEFVAGILADFGQQFIEELVGREVQPLLHRSQQAVLAEFLLRLAVDFKQAIGEKEDHVIRRERAMANRILRLLEQSQCRAVPGIVRFE